MAWYLTAPSHHPNQCGLIFSAILWHLHEAPFWRYIQDIYPWQQFENYQVKITAAFVRGQWVKHAIVLPIPNPSATLIQSSVVITRSNLSRYYTRYCDDSNSNRTWLQTHNRHPIARPHYGLSIIRILEIIKLRYNGMALNLILPLSLSPHFTNSESGGNVRVHNGTSKTTDGLWWQITQSLLPSGRKMTVVYEPFYGHLN